VLLVRRAICPLIVSLIEGSLVILLDLSCSLYSIKLPGFVYCIISSRCDITLLNSEVLYAIPSLATIASGTTLVRWSFYKGAIPLCEHASSIKNTKYDSSYENESFQFNFKCATVSFGHESTSVHLHLYLLTPPINHIYVSRRGTLEWVYLSSKVRGEELHAQRGVTILVKIRPSCSFISFSLSHYPHIIVRLIGTAA
jgi:hypothetical protein